MHAFTTTGVLAVLKLPSSFFMFSLQLPFYEDSSILIVNIQCG